MQNHRNDFFVEQAHRLRAALGPNVDVQSTPLDVVVASAGSPFKEMDQGTLQAVISTLAQMELHGSSADDMQMDFPLIQDYNCRAMNFADQIVVLSACVCAKHNRYMGEVGHAIRHMLDPNVFRVHVGHNHVDIWLAKRMDHRSVFRIIKDWRDERHFGEALALEAQIKMKEIYAMAHANGWKPVIPSSDVLAHFWSRKWWTVAVQIRAFDDAVVDAAMTTWRRLAALVHKPSNR